MDLSKYRLQYQLYVDGFFRSLFHHHYSNIEPMSFNEWIRVEYEKKMNNIRVHFKITLSVVIAFLLSLIFLKVQPFEILPSSSYIVISTINLVAALSSIVILYLKITDIKRLTVLVSENDFSY